MQVRKLAVTSAVAFASFTALGLSTPAYALCDAYSGGCPSTPPAGGGGTDIDGGGDSPATGNEGAGTGGDSPTSDNDNAGSGAAPGGTSGTGPTGTATSPSTLPFTGGELVLMTAAGLGALAGGTALVVAGRRRAQTPA